MKKTLLSSLLLLALYASSFSQSVVAPNGGMENWTTTGPVTDPDGWFTPNSASISFGGTATVLKETSDFHGGAAAAKLTTVQGTFTFPGAMTNGALSVTFALTGGTPFTGRPVSFKGFYKYTPGPGDSAIIKVFLFKRNSSTNARDTVASVVFKEPNTVGTYTQFDKPFTYTKNWPLMNENPDSVLILVGSSADLLSPKLGSVLLIDDMSFEGTKAPSAVKNVSGVKMQVSAYPNPASSQVSLTFNGTSVAKVNVYDILGKKVKTMDVTGMNANVPVGELEEGLYFYRLANKEDVVLATGKFSIKR